MEFWQERVKAFYSWYLKPGPKRRKKRGHGQAKTARSGPRDLPSVLIVFPHVQQIESAEEVGLQWKDIGEANLDESYLYPEQASYSPCPVIKQQLMSKED